MSAAASSERWEECRSDDELVFGGEIKECESVIASLLCALLHFIDSYHGHNSKNLLPTLWAVLDTCDERRRERSGGLSGKNKDGKCVHDSQWRWNGLEGAEGEDGAPYSSGICHTINSVCRGEVAMETPPLHPIYWGFHGDGAFTRHFGVALEARDTAEAILSLTHHVPIGTVSCGPLWGCIGDR